MRRMEIAVYSALVLLGLCFGSFAGATVWRLRARQLAIDKQQHETYDKKEYARLKKLTSHSALSDRSQCLHCNYQLRWYDLIPVVSWLTLKGKCRNCRKPIGSFELLIELGMAAFFVLSYVLWPLALGTPLEVAHFILWLVAGVIMGVLFAYDAKWFLLPDKYTWALAVVGLAMLAVRIAQGTSFLEVAIQAIGAVGVLSGLYAVLFVVSKGRWIGFGDVKLGIGLGLLLGNWQLALLALFLANLIGCLIVIPLMLVGKLKRNAHVPFGPMLIAGTVSAWFLGLQAVIFYLTHLGM
jgi:prepilin signal peptidase PulO-like enzyme (type II secretory pathway)